MRFLHCIHSLNPAIGGPAEFIRQSVPLYHESGHEVEIACLDPPDAPWLKDFRCVVHPYGPGLFKYGFSPGLLNWLARHNGRFDLMVVNGLWQFSSLAPWIAVHRTNTPYVVFVHGMLDPWFNQRYRIKFLKKRLYWPWGLQPVLREARAVLFTSQEECTRARNSFTPYECNEVVVGYGTPGASGDGEFQRSIFFQKYPETTQKRRLLFLSRIHEKKGCDLLLQAFVKLAGDYPDLHLIMAGPCADNYADDLKGRFESQSLKDRITWTGMIEGDLKWGALRAADVLVLPSHQENFAIVVAESLSCGTPVLISDKVNTWREIAGAGAGLVDSDDFDGTFRLLKNWLDKPAGIKDEMRAAARKCFEARFDLNKFFAKYLSVLEECAVR